MRTQFVATTRSERAEVGQDTSVIYECGECFQEIYDSSRLGTMDEFTHFATGRRECYQPGETDDEFLILVATLGREIEDADDDCGREYVKWMER